jgi:hypothetical protein
MRWSSSCLTAYCAIDNFSKGLVHQNYARNSGTNLGPTASLSTRIWQFAPGHQKVLLSKTYTDLRKFPDTSVASAPGRGSICRSCWRKTGRSGLENDRAISWRSCTHRRRTCCSVSPSKRRGRRGDNWRGCGPVGDQGVGKEPSPTVPRYAFRLDDLRAFHLVRASRHTCAHKAIIPECNVAAGPARLYAADVARKAVAVSNMPTVDHGSVVRRA